MTFGGMRKAVQTSAAESLPRRGIGNRLILIALTLVTLGAGKPSVAAPPLWLVKSGANSLFLYGSLHLLPDSTSPLTPLTKRSFETSTLLLLEIADLQDNVKLTQAATLRSIKFSKKAFDDLSADQLFALSIAIKESGLTPSYFSGTSKWIMAQWLSLHIAEKAGFSAKNSMESKFLAGARFFDMKVEGVESIEEQVEALAPDSDEQASAELSDTLSDFGRQIESIKNINTAWEDGDVQTLSAISSSLYKDYPARREKFLLSRNRLWADRILLKMKQHDRIFAVLGITHLVGGGNLIAELMRRGCVVKRIQ